MVYVKILYKRNDEFVYVNGMDRRKNHPNRREPHQHEPDDGYREHHNKEEYDVDEEDHGDNGPDVDLDQDDYNKGIDPSYKKHSKKHYIFAHTFVEFAAALALLIVFFILLCVH